MSLGSQATKKIIILTAILLAIAAGAQVPGTAPFAFLKRKAMSSFVGDYRYLQETTGNDSGTVTSLTTIEFPGEVASGNFILCSIFTSSETSVVLGMTDSAGNTYRHAVGPTNQTGFGRLDTFYAYNVNGGTIDVTATFTTPVSGAKDFGCVEYSGIASASDPLVVTSAANGSAGTSSSGSATVSAVPSVLIGTLWNSGCASAALGGLTMRAQPFCNMIADRLLTSTGSYDAQFDPAGNEWIDHMTVFKLGNELRLHSDGDDGYFAGIGSVGESWYYSGDQWWGIAWMGEYQANSREYGYFRFQIPSDMPAGSTIENATIKIWQNGSFNWNSATDALRIWLQKTSSAPMVDEIADYPGDLGGTVLTTASTRWPPTGGLAWGDDAYITSPSFHTALQELVDSQGGLTAGDYFQVWIAIDTITNSAKDVSFIDSANQGDSNTLESPRPPSVSIRFTPPGTAGAATKLKLSGPTKINTGVCSAVYHVKTLDANNITANATSNVTVNLTSSLSGNFYSNSTCTNQVTSVQINSGTNTASFYFKNNISQTVNLTATDNAAVLTADTLSSVVVSLRPFTWIGGGGNSNWTNAANWSHGVVPQWGVTAYFDSNCTSCNATIDADISGFAIKMVDGYLGTITQADNVDASFGIACDDNFPAFVQTSGTWSGGTTNTSFSSYGGFSLLGGNFSTPTGETVLECGTQTILASATLTATQGKIRQRGGSTINWNGQTINNYWIDNSYHQVINGTVTINGNLELGETGSVDMQYFGGTGILNLKGNLVFNSVLYASDDGFWYPKTTIKFIGTNPQTWTGSGGAIGNVEFASAGGVTLPATSKYFGDFYHTSGSVTVGTNVILMGDAGTSATSSFSAASLNFNNITLGRVGTMTVTGDMNVTGNLTVDASYTNGNYMILNGGNINVTGNIVGTDWGATYLGNTSMTLIGSNVQTVSNGTSEVMGGTWTINKTGGQVNLVNNLIFGAGQDIVVQAGTFDFNNRNITGDPDLTVASGAKVQLRGSETATLTSFTPQSGSSVEYYGNASTTNWTGLKLGDTYHHLKFSSTATNTYTLNNTLTVNGNLEIASGTLASNTRQITLGGNWIKTGTFTITSGLTGGTLLLTDANHSFTGSTTFNRIRNNTLTASRTLTFAAGSTQTFQTLMTLAGNTGFYWLLRSSSPGSQWTLTPSNSIATAANDYLDVQDSISTVANTYAGVHGVNSGNNNANWTFNTDMILNSSLVPRVFGNVSVNTDVSTASFLPPENALLLVAVHADAVAGDITMSVSSSPALTWTKAIERDKGDGASAHNGHTSIWWAKTGAVTATYQVRVRRTAPAGTQTHSFKVLVISNTHSSPIATVGASNKESSTVNVFTSQNLTTSANGSRVIGAGTDYLASAGVPVSTDVVDAATYVGLISVGTVWKSADTASSGTAVNLNLDWAGAGAVENNFCQVEVIRAP
jgi:hypothetical protein